MWTESSFWCGTKLLYRCAKAWASPHIGCAKRAPYCTVSMTQVEAPRSPDDLTSPVVRGAYTHEVFVVKPATAELRRLAHARSARFTTDSYWSTPRAAMSPDAGYVVFDSNLGKPTRELV